MYIDFGPDVAFGALFPFLESVADLDNGLSVVAGGAGGLPCALAAVARSAAPRSASFRLEPATRDQLPRSRNSCGLATAPWDEVRSASSAG
jgi:hypothetical protein